MSQGLLTGEPILVADIGGTNARFALVNAARHEELTLFAVRRYAVAEFASLAAAIRRYLQDADIAACPQRAVLGVAAPVKGDRIAITNNPWRFSLTELRAELHFEAVTAVNDFSANSMSLPFLKPAELAAIGSGGQANGHRCGLGGSDRTLAVIGPGTGLGVGALLLRGGRAIPVDSEGGHISFAPTSAYEFAILQALQGRFERVSYERLICGPGLMNLYRAVGEIDGVPADATAPEQITERAVAAPEGVEGRSLSLFCEILGACAGDVALMFAAWDGVYLAGGMLATLMPWLTTGGFRRRFEAKGRYRATLQAVPTFAILHPDLGLLGAAAHAWVTQRY